MSNAAIRAAGPDDAASLCRLIAELAEEEGFGAQLRATEPLLRAELSSVRPTVRFLLAERDGQLVGFCAWYLAFSTFEGKATLFVEDVFVRRDARGLGVASAFLCAVAATAREQELPRVEWRVQSVNSHAIALFRAHGIAPTTEWRFCRMTPAQIAHWGLKT